MHFQSYSRFQIDPGQSRESEWSIDGGTFIVSTFHSGSLDRGHELFDINREEQRTLLEYKMGSPERN